MMNRFLLGLVMILAVVSCKDSFDDFNPDDPIIPNPPIEETFNASAFVEVVDIDGIAVEGAVLALGSEHLTTDEYGLVHFDKVAMGTFTYMTVEKSGYFHGSRRFYPAVGKTEHLKIMLLSDNSIGEFEAGSGGTVAVLGGVTLDFPVDGYVTSNGDVHTGAVVVSAQAIPANDSDLSIKMPGDLVGTTEDDKVGALASMGMVVVELRSTSGDLLQVKEGSSVKMTMQVPSDMMSSAPASIPMWYFDEATGLWKEEGSAILSGDSYVANVGHFSYWNYDAWFPIVKLTASFVYESGPATNVSVCITILELQAKKCASTNDEGIICGMVAADELLLMEVVDPCGNIVYSAEIGPFSDSTTIGPITIPESAVTLTTITGNGVDCDGNAVTNGYARIKSGGILHYVALDESDGSFDLTFMNCNEEDVIVTIVDESALKQSLPQSYAYAATIDAGAITVCETITELIILSVDGQVDEYLFFFPWASVTQGITTIGTTDSSGTEAFFYISFDGDTPGTYELNSLEVGIPLSGGGFANATQATVVITYFGDVGDFVQGTISGVMNDNPQGGGNDINFTGTISALRQ